MNLKKSFLNIFLILYNYTLKNSSKVGFTCVILFAGVGLILTVRGSIPLLICSVFFTILLLLTNFWRGQLLFKYIFSIIAFTLFYISVLFCNVSLLGLERVSYYIPLIYAYLLPDIITPSIIGIIIIQLYSTYFGKTYSSDVTSNIIGTLYASITYSVVFYLVRRLTSERDKFHKISITDSLTGLSTLKYFVEKGQEILDKTSESAVLLIDLDHFKQINDTYGHLIGNKVLIDLSDLLKKELMNTNCIIGRLGGDEFVIFLYNLSKDQVRNIMQQLYHSINNNVFYINQTLPPLKISFTIGEAHSSQRKRLTIQELLNQADSNMYYNKFGEYKLPYNSLLSKIKLTDKCKQLLRTLEEKDMYTYIHSQYTAQYAAELAVSLGFEEKRVKDIYLSGLLHDIGKLYIPNDILRKPGKLSSEEYMSIKGHVTDGLNILKDIQLSEIILSGLKYHHERFDGTGYPSRIRGIDTPIEGRIIQIADAFSAMTIKRVYRESLSLDDAILELRKNSGLQFDPELINIFIELFKGRRSAI